MARSNKQPLRKVRVREIPLEEIDVNKLALAYWLMAKRLLEEEEGAGEERTLP
jgi:hypothetical protein